MGDEDGGRRLNDFLDPYSLGMDAAKWAAAFCETAKKHGHDLDEGWMIAWFANAIMVSHDITRGVRPTVLPDGSAFIVDTIA